MLSAILIFFAVAIGAALLASIRFRFRLDEIERVFSISYLFAGFKIDMLSRSGRLYLFGLPIKGFRLEAKRKRPKEALAKGESAERKRGGKRKILGGFRWKDIWIFTSLLKKIKSKGLMFNIAGGLGDPFETAKVFAAYSVLGGMMPSLMSRVNYFPDFTKAGLKFEGKGVIYIRVWHLVSFALRFIYKKWRDNSAEKKLIKKKGVSYA
jgi:hypothetical protein